MFIPAMLLAIFYRIPGLFQSRDWVDVYSGGAVVNAGDTEMPVSIPRLG